MHVFVLFNYHLYDKTHEHNQLDVIEYLTDYGLCSIAQVCMLTVNIANVV